MKIYLDAFLQFAAGSFLSFHNDGEKPFQLPKLMPHLLSPPSLCPWCLVLLISLIFLPPLQCKLPECTDFLFLSLWLEWMFTLT